MRILRAQQFKTMGEIFEVGGMHGLPLVILLCMCTRRCR